MGEPAFGGLWPWSIHCDCDAEKGDFHRIVLGIAVMSLFVVLINRALWRPLYQHAERKYRLG